jgi:predicted nucleic acid-binding protein
LAPYFIDTSALAKLYRREPGSDVIDRVLSESGSQLLVSRLALVEMESGAQP